MNTPPSLNSIFGELWCIYVPASLVDDPRKISRALLTLDFGLEPLELKVHEFLSTGKTNGELAIAMDISEDRVKDLLESLYKKLGVNNRTEAAYIALKYGLGDQSPKVRRSPKNS